MNKHLIAPMAITLAMGMLPSFAYSRSELTNEQIKQAIIQQSIASYPGNCPCPYNVARNGSRCGKRAAYSRVGGYAPLCYSEDVTDEMVRKYKKSR